MEKESKQFNQDILLVCSTKLLEGFTIGARVLEVAFTFLTFKCDFTKEATVGWRYHKRLSYHLPLLIYFNCCCSCTAGYDILLNKTILNLA